MCVTEIKFLKIFGPNSKEARGELSAEYIMMINPSINQSINQSISHFLSSVYERPCPFNTGFSRSSLLQLLLVALYDSYSYTSKPTFPLLVSSYMLLILFFYFHLNLPILSFFFNPASLLQFVILL
jgi:hypothetical protein